MKKLFLAISLLFPLIASAQGLHKDIDVEQSVTPSKRDAVRIGVLPTVRLAPFQAPSLSYSSKVIASPINSTLTVLDPVAWGDKLYTSPYRGYFDLGLGYPLALGDVSGGYRLVDTDKTRLNIWGQYNGDVYKRSSVTWHDHTATLGVGVSQALNAKSRIKGAVDYTYGFHDMPGVAGRFSESSSRVNASIGLATTISAVDLGAGLRFRHFGLGNTHYAVKDDDIIAADPAAYDIDPVSQNLYGIDLTGKVVTGESSAFDLGVKADILATSRSYLPVIPFWDLNGGIYRAPMPSRTTGLIGINPSYTFATSTATIKVGAMLDVSVNDGNTLKVAPDVSLAWHGMQFLAAELRLHGGSTLNTLASLYDITPYLNPTFAYYRSHSPWAFDAKIAFGPFFGGTVEMFGGYAKANDWLMPVADLYYAPGATWEAVDVKGYRFGLRLGYDNGRTFALSASWEHSAGGWDNAWIDNRDRARNIVNAGVKVRPFEPWQIEVSYELRAGRSIYGYSEDTYELLGQQVFPLYRESLGTISNLSLGTSYAVSEPLSFFARAENILSRRALLLGSRPTQGFTILAGVSLKF